MPPQLTRYLYFLDECLYSLMFALIRAQKSTLEEVVFWAAEIYYSGFQDVLWEHIWKIYYDFYAIKYPKYEKKINKLSKEPESLKNIIYLLNLMYYAKPCYNVFTLRMMNPESPSHAYLGRLPTWLKELELNKENSKLIRSIHNNKKTNIAFYINRTTDYQKTYTAIKKYFAKNSSGMEGCLKQKNLNAINYTNKNHILLALICHLSLNREDIQIRTIFKKLDNTLLTKEVNFNDDSVEPLYKTLTHKRLFRVSPLIGVFQLERHNTKMKDYKDILRLHWDYFAYSTPLWNKRIKLHNGILDHKKYELTFKNDDDHEAFYEAYNYEPDEQSKEVQEKSIGEINKEIGEQWLIGICKNNKMNISVY